ncbi:MAG: KpsF/GutQ family sugar-phosphate isomerase [Bacteroidetes bacterium]|nr:KpsF/GutQ family sugar-phosphate isomerase [Bacteroidota bacterium]
MKSYEEIKNIALSTINNEADSIINLKNYIDNDFAKCVEIIYKCKGRIIISGIGKSANIGAKIVSTFNSTGTPAIFMHAADAIHGDLGIIQPDDIIICLSKSGNTPEIKVLVPLIKSMGNKIIAMHGNIHSYLAQQADYSINCSVEKEACPNNLAPTSSTTAQLVMGDALAVALLECRGFTTSDFAKYHPGGALGKQLYLKVADLSINNEVPMVNPETDVKKTIIEITSKRLGAAAVVENEIIIGIVTDGDLRRMLQNDVPIEQLKAKDIMSLHPKTIQKDELAVTALNVMKQNNITQLLVVDDKNIYIGVIHLHDLLREGII